MIELLSPAGDLEKLKIALKSYEKQSFKPQYILVVNNNSTDGTLEYLKEWKSKNNKIENRKKYMTTKRILSKFINILVPIILGTSIELTSFGNIAIYIFVLTLFQIMMSLQIDTNKFVIEDKIEKYNLKNYITDLSIKQKENSIFLLF